MKLIDTIIEKENCAIRALNECNKNGYKTYILGNGEGADNVELRLEGFQFAGRLVNKKYYSGGERVFCLEDILESCTEKVNIIVAYRGFKSDSLKVYESKIANLINFDIYAGNCSVDSRLMTYSWVEKNIDKLERVYAELEDDYSRKVFSSYINQKISSDYKYLREVKTSPQYFETDVIYLNDSEVFVDCGAYNGDSAASFIEALKENGIEKYKRIYSFEPDPINYKLLNKRGFENHICINKGTSCEIGELRFSILGTSSVFDNDGTVKVPVVALDNEINEEVSFIKMDVEGAELDSLKGASKLISCYHPKMAICIYHRKEDLWEIQNYLKSLVPEYKFFVRAYEDEAIELVLYAII